MCLGLLRRRAMRLWAHAKPDAPPLTCEEWAGGAGGGHRASDELVELLMRQNLARKECGAGGNCLFLCLEHVLGLIGETRSAGQLRALAVQSVRQHSSLYAGYLQDGVSPQQWCDAMAADGEWGDHLAIKALAWELNRPIHVWQHSNVKDGQRPNCTMVSATGVDGLADKGAPGGTLHIVLLGAQGQGDAHFQAAVPRAGIEPTSENTAMEVDVQEESAHFVVGLPRGAKKKSGKSRARGCHSGDLRHEDWQGCRVEDWENRATALTHAVCLVPRGLEEEAVNVGRIALVSSRQIPGRPSTAQQKRVMLRPEGGKGTTSALFWLTCEVGHPALLCWSAHSNSVLEIAETTARTCRMAVETRMSAASGEDASRWAGGKVRALPERDNGVLSWSVEVDVAAAPTLLKKSGTDGWFARRFQEEGVAQPESVIWTRAEAAPLVSLAKTRDEYRGVAAHLGAREGPIFGLRTCVSAAEARVAVLGVHMDIHPRSMQLFAVEGADSGWSFAHLAQTLSGSLFGPSAQVSVLRKAGQSVFVLAATEDPHTFEGRLRGKLLTLRPWIEDEDERGRGRKASASPQGRETKTSVDKTCWTCGVKGHLSRACPTAAPSQKSAAQAAPPMAVQLKRCFNCGELGHLRIDCTATKMQDKVTEISGAGAPRSELEALRRQLTEEAARTQR